MPGPGPDPWPQTAKNRDGAGGQDLADDDGDGEASGDRRPREWLKLLCVGLGQQMLRSNNRKRDNIYIYQYLEVDVVD